MAGRGSFKHNRKRNCGLVYEFLVRHLTSKIIDKDVHGYKKTLGIIKKYFSEGSLLSKERELFDVIKSTRGVSEQVARGILCEVKKHASEFDIRRIDIKKSNLIKDVNYTFGMDFFSKYRLPEYRLLASIQMVVDSVGKKSTITENVQTMQLEEGLVEFMKSSDQKKQRLESENKVDDLVCAIASKKFQDKYSSTLSGGQKAMLEKYMYCMMSGDKKEFVDSLKHERSLIIEKMNRAEFMKEIRDDKVMKERLSEARAKLLKEDLDNFTENSVQDMMLFMRLVEEIESEDE